MKLQIRTLSVQERKELYTQALVYFQIPREDRDDNIIQGVCEFLHRKFYFKQISSDWSITRPIIESELRKLSYDYMPVYMGKDLMPELYRRKTRESSEEDDSWWGDYWFHDDNERLIALEDCLYDTAFLMEEEDEQGPTVYAEFEVDWEPQA